MDGKSDSYSWWVMVMTTVTVAKTHWHAKLNDLDEIVYWLTAYFVRKKHLAKCYE